MKEKNELSSNNNSLTLFTLFLVLNVAFQLISDATAGKLVNILGFGVSVTVIYFPFVYIISDVVTEVYGYARSRQILWYTLLASILAGLMYQLAVIVPPASYFEAQQAYETVFGIVPRVLLGGWIAVFLGDVTNNFILAKMKVFMKGKTLWARTIGSTIAGQFVNTAAFYLIALSGVLSVDTLIQSIIAGWLIKTFVEVLMTPFTYWVVIKVKKIEGIDYYDKNTNFNPFRLKLK